MMLMTMIEMLKEDPSLLG